MNTNFFKIKKLSQFFLFNFKKKMIFITFSVLIIPFLDILGIGLIYPFLSLFFNKDLNIDFFLFDFLKNFAENERLIVYSIFFISFIFFKNIFQSFLIFKQLNIVNEIHTSISKRMFYNYSIMPKLLMGNEFTARIMKNIINEPKNFLKGIVMSIINISTEIIIIIGGVLYLIYINPTSLIIISIFPVLFLIFQRSIKFKASNWGKIIFNEEQNRFKNLIDFFDTRDEFRASNREGVFSKVFDKSSNLLKVTSSKIQFFSLFPKYVLEFLLVLVMVALIFYYSKSLEPQEVIFTELSFLVLVILKLLPSVNKLMILYKAIREQKELFLNFFDLVKKFESYNVSNKTNLEKPFKKLVFKDVSFSYKENNKVIKNISFEINRGDKLGIFGSSGSGKSSLLYLITGLVQKDTGEIIYNNRIESIYDCRWGTNIAYLPQRTFLFSGSIKENIIFGEEKLDEERLEKILEIVQLKDFFEKNNKDVNTFLGNKGSLISGGQSQRLALARNLYNQPEILVLDEAFSALDDITSNKIISELIKIDDLTIILVSHNYNLLKNFEKVFEVSNNTLTIKNF